MKPKLFLMIAAAAIVFAACSKDVYNLSYFASTQTWTVGGPTWSDAVQIPECDKADFDGGTPETPQADCRSYTREGKTYYYYSWVYVDQKLDLLCPSPWRVPTKDDFINLDIALGGDGEYRYVEATYVPTKYILTWGGTYHDYVEPDGSIPHSPTRNEGAYWSRSPTPASDGAYGLSYTMLTESRVYFVEPAIEGRPECGAAVRCVK